METVKIKITGVETKDYEDNTQYRIKTNQYSYVFYKFKKGTQTTSTAFQQFQKYRFVAGDEVEIGVSVVPPKPGNKYPTRYLSYFAVNDNNTTPKEPKLPEIQLEDEEESFIPPKEDDRIGEILDNTRIIIDMLSPVAPKEDIPIIGEGGGEIPF